MASDVRAALEKGSHELPPGWTWEWFTDVMDVEGGTQPPAATFVDSPRTGYVRLVQIRDFETDAHLTYIPDSPKWRKCSTADVLIGRYGAALGRICTGLSGAYNVALAKVVPSERLHQRFVYYLLNSRYFQAPLIASGARSAQAGFNKDGLAVIPLPLPPLPEQKRIAHVLGTLDEKINLNRRMNATLEGMSRAIFKSWFVDFDPVRQKAAGQKPVGMDAQTSALFPDSFEDSEIGEVPKGWRVGRLGDVADHPRRPARPTEIPMGTAYIGLEHMPRRCIALSDWGTGESVESNKFEFRRGEILFGKLRPYFHKVGVAPTDGVCSTDIVVARPKSDEWFGVVLGHMSSDEFVAYADAGSTGTKMPRTNWEDMSRYGIAIPPASIANVFSDLVGKVVDSMIGRIHHSRTLAALRDALLPKLLSGEVPVPVAEGMVEEAVV